MREFVLFLRVSLGAVGWALREHLNEQRLKQSRNILTKVDPLIAKADALFAQGIGILNSAIIIQKASSLRQERLSLFNMRIRRGTCCNT